jgi:allantoin racemase
MRIRDIVPVRSPKVIEGMQIQRQRWASEDVQIEVVPITHGPYSMEFATEEVLAGPHILEAAIQAERDGVDAIVLDCMVDPVLRAARETVSIPVLAPALAGLAMASLLGSRIAVIGMRNGQQLLEEHIRAYGFSHKVCSMHAVHAPPAELIDCAAHCLPLIEAEIASALSDHRAEVILFGCTAMSGYVDTLNTRLNVPVLEPMACAINLAIATVRMGISHSKRCYETLPERGVAEASLPIPGSR